ncbi:MAG: hypothetical protein JEZ07_14000 [Phycisphaerae bacterium]|nr:hypothetical protein [Phycisphaerae bacterium]
MIHINYSFKIILFLVFILVKSLPVLAETQVKVEKGDIKNGTYIFDNIAPPSAADAASGCKIIVKNNKLDPSSADASWLVNGVLSATGGKPSQAVFFTNDNSNGGQIIIDMGKVVSIASINTYSYHEFPGDQGARAPQVYDLYGSVSVNLDLPVNISGGKWVQIASVDSRPNTTGKEWNGIYGVNICNEDKDIGRFRYLLWDIKPTNSPLQSQSRWTNTFFTEFDVHTSQTVIKDNPAMLAGRNPNVKEVIVVFKTHFDIGFTDLARNVLHNYRTKMIDRALEVVEASNSFPVDKRFVWTVPGWPMARIMDDWQGQTKKRQESIWKAFTSGRFAVHALAYTMHTESVELEDMVRTMLYSSRLSRKAGLKLPRAAKMTDVPSHSWILPALLKHAGVDFLHLGCNPASQSPNVPLLFWWQGPDDSRLLTMYASEDYGTDLVPPENWPHKTWLAMIMTGDNHGPPSADMVKKLLDRANKELGPDVKVRFGRLDDFAEAILAEDTELPVIKGDMPDSWIHGQMTSPIETGIARRWRPLINAAESVNTLLRQLKIINSSNDEAIARAYDNSIRYGEHTWAINTAYMQPHRSYGEEFEKELKEGRFAKYQESWREKGEHALNIRDITSDSLTRDMSLLAQAVEVNGKRIAVYNALPWARDGLVELIIPGFQGKSLLDTHSGKCISFAKATGDKIIFIASDVPAMGYRAYRILDESILGKAVLVANESESIIENRFFSIKLDPAIGSIVSIIDKQTGRQLVDTASEYGFGQYFYERFGTAQVQRFLEQYLKIHTGWAYNDLGKRDLPELSYFADHSRNGRLVINRDEISVSAVISFEPNETIDCKHSITVKLFDDQPYIDINWSVNSKKPNAYPEAGWVSLPFKLNDVDFRLARLGGIVDPVSDIVDNTYKDIVCLNGGMTVVDHSGYSIGICPLDSPLISLERPGLWRFSRNFLPKKPVVFVNLYNNMWGTNFRQWISGSWSSCIRLWASSQYNSQASLISPANSSRMPLVAGFADGPKGNAPSYYEGLSLSRKGIAVTAFGDNPDGEGIVLRLWEQAGKSGICTVRLPADMVISNIEMCDLRGRPIAKSIKMENNQFDVQINANAPVSFIIFTRQ